MDVPHHFGAETFRLAFSLLPVYPAFGQQLLVEPLQVSPRVRRS